ncbi:MAG: DegV family protein, partial [Acholeplasmataceae bacterium]|nr:DegV family protein [Acholeplasmataceae bacterium]
TTFYELLKKANSFSSTQPDKRTIERTFDFLSDHYDQILVITVSSKMSSTYNTLVQYQKTNPKLTVFDSRQNSGSEGLIALAAARLIEAGKPLDLVVEELSNIAKRTKIYVSVKTLKYMVKQGRVSKVTGLLAKIMNLKPVVSIDSEGKGIIKEKALSLRRNQKQIVKLLQKRPLEEYVIVHALEPERAQKLAQRIEKATGKKASYITEISPIVAMNAGIGAVAAACIYQEEI